MKKIGIIGGMGPLATIDIFNKIVINTPANKDQDHIPILIYNNPQIPDRTQSILSSGKSPVDDIVKTGKTLIDMGADYLIMPCNTSHYYYESISSKLSIPLINMIDTTIEKILDEKIKKVVVLGTEGTLSTEIYEKKLSSKGIDYIKVDKSDYHLLDYVIYDIVKAGNFELDITEFINLLDKYQEDGVEAFILGCTELPILFEEYKLNYKTIDPTEILAMKAIDLSVGK